MRSRKSVSIVLITAFLVMTASCTSLRSVSPDSMLPEGKRRIVRIEKTSGEELRIHKGTQVRIVDGEVHIGGRISVPGRGTKIDRLAEGYAITPPGGPTYETDAFNSSGRRLIFTARTDVVIAVSEVAAIWMKEADNAKTMLAVVGGITAVLGIAGLIVAAAWDPLPFFLGGL